MFSLIIRFLFVGCLVLAACSPQTSFPEGTPPPTPLRKPGEGEPAQGQINGQKWAFKSGRAYTLRRMQERLLMVQLWNEVSENPCLESRGSTLQVRLVAPFATGHWSISPEDPFNATLSIFFVDANFKPRPWDFLRADQGDIQFDQITSREVKGYFSGSFLNPRTGETRIIGDFKVPLCFDGR